LLGTYRCTPSRRGLSGTVWLDLSGTSSATAHSASSALALTDAYAASARDLATSVSFGPRQRNTLMLLIKMPAMVTVYRVHCRTLYFLPRIICLIIMCIGIIMVALCNRADHYIFILFLLLSSFFSSPNLSGRKLDVYHTLAHDVALVRI